MSICFLLDEDGQYMVCCVALNKSTTESWVTNRAHVSRESNPSYFILLHLLELSTRSKFLARIFHVHNFYGNFHPGFCGRQYLQIHPIDFEQICMAPFLVGIPLPFSKKKANPSPLAISRSAIPVFQVKQARLASSIRMGPTVEMGNLMTFQLRSSGPWIWNELCRIGCTNIVLCCFLLQR